MFWNVEFEKTSNVEEKLNSENHSIWWNNLQDITKIRKKLWRPKVIPSTSEIYIWNICKNQSHPVYGKECKALFIRWQE